MYQHGRGCAKLSFHVLAAITRRQGWGGLDHSKEWASCFEFIPSELRVASTRDLSIQPEQTECRY